jgi:hypothetical protein
VSESFGTSGAEALGSRCRGLFGVGSVSGSTSRGVAALANVRPSPWLKEQIREGSRARAGPRSRRRDGEVLGCQCAEDESSWFSVGVRAVKDPSDERHERLDLSNRGQRSGSHLEEQKTRRGERSQVRSNRRSCDSRLCMEKRLEVEGHGPWQPIRR